jgi:DeoR family transcriptional regulator of aga operon
MNSRQRDILDRINSSGRITIEGEAQFFGVSEMTIRRDIVFLEKQGLAVQVKGGAMPKARICETSSAESDSTVKAAIAEKAIELLEQMPEVSTLLLSTGTTTLAFAKKLALVNRSFTVLTNSIPIASALFQTQVKVILTGGELRTNSMDMVGPAAEKYLADYHVDLLITGCDGANAEEGFYTSDLNLASFEKLSVKISDRVMILTESLKFKRKSLAKFAELSDVEFVVTDDRLKKLDREFILRSGIKCEQVNLR